MIHRSRPYSELIREAAPLKRQMNTTLVEHISTTHRQIQAELKQAYLKLLRIERRRKEKNLCFFTFNRANTLWSGFLL